MAAQKKQGIPITPDSTEKRGNDSKEIEGALFATNLNVCFQCGTCSGGCPVTRFVPEYNIRKIIKEARENGVESIDQFSWFCSTCYLCYERCPQDVKPIQIVHRITNLISKKGCAPIPVKEGNRAILNTGRIVEVSRITQERRKQLGLPDLKPDVSADFKKIAKLTALEKMVQ